MLRLDRNNLGDVGIFIDKNGNKIYWQNIAKFQKHQDEEELHLGNKLKLAHIQWRQQKMKVNFAAQSFSSSVADAIDYCHTTLKLQQFEGSETTVEFIRVIDPLFDILNFRNPHEKAFK